MLHPAKVGVAFGRGAVLPAHILFQPGMPPVLDIERRVGHDKIGAQVRVLVIQKTVGVLFAKVKVDAANGHIHGRQLPGGGVALLTIHGDMLFLLAGVVMALFGVLLNKLLTGDKETTGAHGRVIHPPLKGLQHFHNQGDDAFRRVVLATLFAFRQGELAEEVFIYVAKNILAVQFQLFALVFGVAEAGVRETVNQADQFFVIQLIVADAVENAFQFAVGFFDLIQRIVDQPGDGAQLNVFPLFVLPDHRTDGQSGGLFQCAPAGMLWYPEDVFLLVVVENFQLIGYGLLVIFIGSEIVPGQVVDIVIVVFLEERFQFFLTLFKRIRHIFQKDQTQHNVLVVGGIKVTAQFVRSFP